MTDNHTEQSLDMFWDKIEKIEITMLTTHDNGLLRCRPMKAIPDREANRVWFFINRNHHKADEIKRKPEVNLSFVDANAGDYVSVSGRARIIDDREKARKYWSADAAAWFDDGIDDPDMRLYASICFRRNIGTAAQTACTGFLN